MAASGRSLFAFVRFWSRRWTGTDPQRGRDVMVLEAVHDLAAAGRPTSINDVARELGMDQSGASRMVAHARQQGLVERHGAGRIGAAAAITLTAAGEDLLRHAWSWQDDVLARLTAGWPERDVRTLVTLMDRLVREQSDVVPLP
ncbi:MarR family winged helix-turn-helix transcriptional regulator [Actinoplanes sp. DH11]|uniref:MarR family winged helix-turn-helix transcriptional regulator n=1 Tax=Actinoplanes sp. DH11 TaxID=2857011 RepID=UPI001E64428E|nr:MarR family winged helix-turn-helix transcriptional regulator [Actinoplanes sp. DH11]